MLRIVEDLVVGDAEIRRNHEPLSCAAVPSKERVCAARDLEPDPMALPERVGRRPHIDPDRNRAVFGSNRLSAV